MRSPLYRLTERPKRQNDAGRSVAMTNQDMLNAGFFIVDDKAGDILVHAAPGVEPPEGAEIIQDGKRPWVWKDLRATVPKIADRTMRARVRPEPKDVRVLQIRAAKDQDLLAEDMSDAEPEDVDLPPHAWAGDE